MMGVGITGHKKMLSKKKPKNQQQEEMPSQMMGL